MRSSEIKSIVLWTVLSLWGYVANAQESIATTLKGMGYDKMEIDDEIWSKARRVDDNKWVEWDVQLSKRNSITTVNNIEDWETQEVHISTVKGSKMVILKLFKDKATWCEYGKASVVEWWEYMEANNHIQDLNAKYIEVLPDIHEDPISKI